MFLTKATFFSNHQSPDHPTDGSAKANGEENPSHFGGKGWNFQHFWGHYNKFPWWDVCFLALRVGVSCCPFPPCFLLTSAIVRPLSLDLAPHGRLSLGLKTHVQTRRVMGLNTSLLWIPVALTASLACPVFASFLFFTFFSACLCFPFQILCLNGTSFFLAKLLPHTRPPALADAVSQNTFIEGMGVFHSWTRESWYIFKMLYSQPPLHANSLLEMFLSESLFMWFSFPLTWFPPLQTVELPLLHSYCRWKIIKGAMCWCAMWMWKQDETGANF